MTEEQKAQRLAEFATMLDRVPVVSVGERVFRGLLQELIAMMQGKDLQSPDARALIGYSGPPMPPVYVQQTPAPPMGTPPRDLPPVGTPFVSIPAPPPLARPPRPGDPPQAGAPAVNPHTAAQIAAYARPASVPTANVAPPATPVISDADLNAEAEALIASMDAADGAERKDAKEKPRKSGELPDPSAVLGRSDP